MALHEPVTSAPANATTASRSVAAHLRFTVEEPAQLVLSIAVSRRYSSEERLSVRVDGAEVPARELVSADGTVLHLLDVAHANVSVDYSATVEGSAVFDAPSELDLIEYVRPSRYCESDSLHHVARTEFGALTGAEAVAAVRAWVTWRFAYVLGSSRATDGAVATVLEGRGVCRDFAHVTIAMLRALDVPARLTSVYAPGLAPMDFHAVAEAWFDGGWHVVDATGLAPRASFVRIASGRDAADTAFLSSTGGNVNLDSMGVLALTDVLPFDDNNDLVTLH